MRQDRRKTFAVRWLVAARLPDKDGGSFRQETLSRFSTLAFSHLLLLLSKTPQNLNRSELQKFKQCCKSWTSKCVNFWPDRTRKFDNGCCANMSCAVMYHSYPSSSPYLLPTGPPGPPPTNNTLPSLSGFDRINPGSTVPGSTGQPSAAVTPPVNSPTSPHQQQRLPPVNGIPLEPKIEKVIISPLWVPITWVSVSDGFIVLFPLIPQLCVSFWCFEMRSIC